MNVDGTAPLAQDGSGEMFDAIARRYDLLNRLMSLGHDQRWRLRTVDALALRGRARVLDLATGTADLALLLARLVPQATVMAVDPSHEMRRVARRKISEAGLDDRIELVALHCVWEHISIKALPGKPPDIALHFPVLDILKSLQRPPLLKIPDVFK